MAASLNLAPIFLKQLRGISREIVHPRALLKQVGELVAKDCRRSFNEQRLGDIHWEERYPGQRLPKLNIAGALQDFISGRTAPKPNRFQVRPALIDEGMRGGLQGSVTKEVISDKTVRVGTNRVYAALHQAGGESTQNIDKPTQDRIRNWLYPQKKASVDVGLGKTSRSFYFKDDKKRAVTHHGPMGTGPKQKTLRSAYGVHLNRFLPEFWGIGDFLRSQGGEIKYTQKVIERPFVGVTPRARTEVDKLIKFHMKKAQGP